MKAQSVTRTVVSCATTHEDPPPRSQRGAEAFHPSDTGSDYKSNGANRREREVSGCFAYPCSREEPHQTTSFLVPSPSVSRPSSKRLHRPEAATSGCVASSSGLAATNIAPSMSAAWGRGSPLQQHPNKALVETGQKFFKKETMDTPTDLATERMEFSKKLEARKNFGVLPGLRNWNKKSVLRKVEKDNWRAPQQDE